MLVTPEMESITNALDVEKGMVRLLAYLQREHKYSNILQLRLPWKAVGSKRLPLYIKGAFYNIRSDELERVKRII